MLFDILKLVIFDPTINQILYLNGDDIFSQSYYQQADSMTKKELKSCYQLVNNITKKQGVLKFIISKQ